MVAWGQEWGFPWKGTFGDFFCNIEMFYILIVVVVAQMYKCVKIVEIYL